MATYFVIGGQYGSEGKGKISAFLAEYLGAKAVVRCGGPNSGHTYEGQSGRAVFRQLPSAAISTNARLLIPAGGYVQPSILWKEINKYRISHERVVSTINAQL